MTLTYPRVARLAALIRTALAPPAGDGRIALVLGIGALRHLLFAAGVLAMIVATLWTVPVWTPDQLALAISFTAYCLRAPCLKERRFAQRHGDRFARYRADVPYALPRLLKDCPDAQ